MPRGERLVYLAGLADEERKLGAVVELPQGSYYVADIKGLWAILHPVPNQHGMKK